MKPFRIYFLLFLFSFPVFSSAQKASRPEKFWAIAHPFVAGKARKVTKEVFPVVDSIKKLGIIGTDLNGGKLDAFKHSYWMASLSLKIGEKKALKLGKAHEKGNYLEYKKKKMEDGIHPDLVSTIMDLQNNEAGVDVFGNCRTIRSNKDLQAKILHAIEKGKMFVIRKDKQGNYLNCDGTLLNMTEWKGKWKIPKCLIASNQE